MINRNQFPSFLLYQMISTVFCVIVVISNIISVKMVKLPYILDFSVPAGLIIYPLTFLLTGLVTEFFGPRKAKLMIYLTLAMNLLCFGIIQLALTLPTSSEKEQEAFRAVLGLSGLRIFSSLTAYVIAQIVEIQLYAQIKKWTNSRFLWLRNNGSTCASQIVDTAIVDIIYLYWGLEMGLREVLPVMLFSYAYKAFFSLANTPLFYLSVFLIKANWKLPPLDPSHKHSREALYESNM